MNKDPLQSLDDALAELITDNKEVILLQQEKAKLKDKYCQRCGKDLKEYVEAQGEKIQPNEYLTMISILEENIGEEDYTCYECERHYNEINHLDTRCLSCENLQKEKKN